MFRRSKMDFMWWKSGLQTENDRWQANWWFRNNFPFLVSRNALLLWEVRFLLRNEKWISERSLGRKNYGLTSRFFTRNVVRCKWKMAQFRAQFLPSKGSSYLFPIPKERKKNKLFEFCEGFCRKARREKRGVVEPRYVLSNEAFRWKTIKILQIIFCTFLTQHNKWNRSLDCVFGLFVYLSWWAFDLALIKRCKSAILHCQLSIVNCQLSIIKLSKWQHHKNS